MVTARVLQNRVCPTFCLSRLFLGIVSVIFSKFGIVLDSYVKLCMTEPDFPGKYFLAQNEPKTGFFFNLLENLVISFYWIWSIMTIYIICCVPAQIPYLWKFLFLRYQPKCSQPIRLQDFLINNISRTNQWIIKFDQTFYGWAWSEMGVTSVVTGL